MFLCVDHNFNTSRSVSRFDVLLLILLTPPPPLRSPGDRRVESVSGLSPRGAGGPISRDGLRSGVQSILSAAAASGEMGYSCPSSSTSGRAGEAPGPGPTPRRHIPLADEGYGAECVSCLFSTVLLAALRRLRGAAGRPPPAGSSAGVPSRRSPSQRREPSSP
ncbi:unnamed protein product [Merluccius merluccius]